MELIQVFYEQVLPYIHPKILRPSTGICAHTVIRLYNLTVDKSSLEIEPPHPVVWHQADPYISAEPKEKVAVACQNIR